MLRERVKPLASLAAISAMCAVLLAGTHVFTADAIRANRDEAAWRVAFELTGGPFPTAGLNWQAEQIQLPNGFRLRRGSVAGYAGPIDLLVAIAPGDTLPDGSEFTTDKIPNDRPGSPIGVRVTNHRETPGLGDFIDSSRGDWILQFSTRPAAQVDAVTGATITSEAVKRGVSELLQTTDQQPSPP